MAASSSAAAKLALGTVQFGLPYGIANASGQVSPDEVVSILRTAALGGIDTLDTAIAYGDSEAVLGRSQADRFKIISKLPGVPEQTADVRQWVREQVRDSMERLQVDHLEALLLHRPDQLLGPEGDNIYAELLSLRESGRVRRIGVSVYEPAQLEALSGFSIDLVQAPLSPFDQRMVRSGWLDRLKNVGTAFHARSIFLQGLLLMPRNRRPEQFSSWANAWASWDQWLDRQGVTAVEACLRFVTQIGAVERVVVGVDSTLQLQSILAAVDGVIAQLPAELEQIDPLRLNPANWSKSSV